jgi:hypothetical protein
MNTERSELYIEHDGTVRISGRTIPKTAGYCAYTYLEKGVTEIDFFYIGANAGQQAMKAMTIFAKIVREETKSQASVCFEPLRFTTITEDEKGEKQRKDATVWRTVLLGSLPVKN